MSAPAPSRWRVALAAFALGSLPTLALVGGAYYAINRARQPPLPSPRPRPVYSRGEFSRRVLGKSEEEVIEAVGRPDETSEDHDARYWHFKKRTLDPLTQEKDTNVQVVIKDGRSLMSIIDICGRGVRRTATKPDPSIQVVSGHGRTSLVRHGLLRYLVE